MKMAVLRLPGGPTSLWGIFRGKDDEIRRLFELACGPLIVRSQFGRKSCTSALAMTRLTLKEQRDLSARTANRVGFPA